MGVGAFFLPWLDFFDELISSAVKKNSSVQFCQQDMISSHSILTLSEHICF